ncbi:MAG TPA: RHS repeat-associated core domain-containing protein, partial [Acidobacteriota bacterium]
SKTYDSMGRTATETRNISASSYTAQWSYNLAGEVLTTNYPNGWTTTNGYDSVGNLASIGSSFAGTIVGSVTRNAAGQFTQLNYGNGVVNTRSYNSDLELSTLRVSYGATDYLNLTYNYNAGSANNGRITSISNNLDSTATISYSYDALNRLQTAVTTGTQWGLSWTYDRYGNRLSQTATKGSPPSNSLSIDSNTNRVSTWTYDAAGNVSNDGRNTYAYDAENRVISINAGATAYSYDAFGGRVQKTTGSTIVRYYFGLAENTNGTWTRILVATASGVIEWDNGTMLYKSNDHLGNARVVTGSAGTVIGRTDFYPYGEIWSETGTTSKYKFTGKERDTESGNDYFGARYYWNGAGRWLGVDPVLSDLSDPQRLNHYSYCLNDPINFIDADGGDPQEAQPTSREPNDARGPVYRANVVYQVPQFSPLWIWGPGPLLTPSTTSPGHSLGPGAGSTGGRAGKKGRLSEDCQNQFLQFVAQNFKGATGNTALGYQALSRALNDYISNVLIFGGKIGAEAVARYRETSGLNAIAFYNGMGQVFLDEARIQQEGNENPLVSLQSVVVHELTHYGLADLMGNPIDKQAREDTAQQLQKDYSSWIKDSAQKPCNPFNR